MKINKYEHIFLIFLILSMLRFTAEILSYVLYFNGTA
jgi:hypothetical protein